MLGRRRLAGGAVEQVNFDEAALSGPGSGRRVPQYRYLTIQECEPLNKDPSIFLPMFAGSMITAGLITLSLLLLKVFGT